MFLQGNNADKAIELAIVALPGGVIWSYGITDASFADETHISFTSKTYIVYKWINEGVWYPPASPIVDICTHEWKKNDSLPAKGVESLITEQLKVTARMTLDLVDSLPNDKKLVEEACRHYHESNKIAPLCKAGYPVVGHDRFSEMLKTMEYYNRKEMEKRAEIQPKKSESIEHLSPETDNPFYRNN